MKTQTSSFHLVLPSEVSLERQSTKFLTIIPSAELLDTANLRVDRTNQPGVLLRIVLAEKKFVIPKVLATWSFASIVQSAQKVRLEIKWTKVSPNFSISYKYYHSAINYFRQLCPECNIQFKQPAIIATFDSQKSERANNIPFVYESYLLSLLSLRSLVDEYEIYKGVDCINPRLCQAIIRIDHMYSAEMDSYLFYKTFLSRRKTKNAAKRRYRSK
jgi:hypothetical protein